MVTANYPAAVSLKAGESLQVTPGLSPGGEPRFAITPSLPSGLVLDASTGVLSGTASRVSTPRPYVISVVDSDGAVTFATMTLAVGPAASSVDYVPTVLARVGEELRLTPGVRARGAATFSISPALPAGLELNLATGVIDGAPTQSRASLRYRVRMRDLAGTHDAAFVLEVLPSLEGISTGAREVIYPVRIQSQPVPEPGSLPTFPAPSSGKALVGIVTRRARVRAAFDPKSATVRIVSPSEGPRRLLVVGAERLGRSVRLRVIVPTNLRRPVWIDRGAVRLITTDRAGWQRAR